MVRPTAPNATVAPHSDVNATERSEDPVDIDLSIEEIEDALEYEDEATVTKVETDAADAEATDIEEEQAYLGHDTDTASSTAGDAEGASEDAEYDADEDDTQPGGDETVADGAQRGEKGKGEAAGAEGSQGRQNESVEAKGGEIPTDAGATTAEESRVDPKGGERVPVQGDEGAASEVGDDGATVGPSNATAASTTVAATVAAGGDDENVAETPKYNCSKREAPQKAKIIWCCLHGPSAFKKRKICQRVYAKYGKGDAATTTATALAKAPPPPPPALIGGSEADEGGFRKPDVPPTVDVDNEVEMPVPEGAGGASRLGAGDTESDRAESDVPEEGAGGASRLGASDAGSDREENNAPEEAPVNPDGALSNAEDPGDYSQNEEGVQQRTPSDEESAPKSDTLDGKEIAHVDEQTNGGSVASEPSHNTQAGYQDRISALRTRQDERNALAGRREDLNYGAAEGAGALNPPPPPQTSSLDDDDESIGGGMGFMTWLTLFCICGIGLGIFRRKIFASGGPRTGRRYERQGGLN